MFSLAHFNCLERVVCAEQGNALAVHRCMPIVVERLGDNHERRGGGIDLDLDVWRPEFRTQDMYIGLIRDGDQRLRFRWQKNNFVSAKITRGQSMQRVSVVQKNRFLSCGYKRQKRFARLPIVHFARCGDLGNPHKIVEVGVVIGCAVEQRNQIIVLAWRQGEKTFHLGNAIKQVAISTITHAFGQIIYPRIEQGQSNKIPECFGRNHCARSAGLGLWLHLKLFARQVDLINIIRGICRHRWILPRLMCQNIKPCNEDERQRRELETTDCDFLVKTKSTAAVKIKNITREIPPANAR